MSKIKVLGVILTALAFSGCASMEARLSKHVGCTEQEAKVTRNVNAPGYQEYTVICKNIEYSCKIAPFTEFCDPTSNNKPVQPVAPTPVVKKSAVKKK